jgi:hypothetical protein
MLEISTAVLIAAALILVAGFTSLLAFRFGAPLFVGIPAFGPARRRRRLGIHF